MRKHRHQLGISVGMPGPHDFAVRERRRSSCGAAHVHRIPRSTFVTTRNAPPDERGTGEVVKVICPTAKAKNFSRGGLDSWNRFEIAGEIRFLAQGAATRARPGDVGLQVPKADITGVKT
jgi:hypothetical protein